MPSNREPDLYARAREGPRGRMVAACTEVARVKFED